jgi:DNA-binding NarL/FixJ family response regulator
MTTTGRVLICDNDSAFSRGLKTLLTMEGFSVVTASTTAKSIQRLLDDQARPSFGDRFSVVIVDLDFKEKDGSRSGIRILEEARKIPLLESVVCTGEGTQELAAEAITLGVFGYIIKTSSGDLNNLLKTVIRANALHSQCLSLIEEIERLANAHPGIPEIKGLSPRFVEYVRTIRGRGR